MAPRKRPYRLLALFALSVFVPAFALAVLSYRSVAQERRALVAERESGLRRAGLLIHRELDYAIRRVRLVEEQRPYYHYNQLFFEPRSVGKGVNYLQSPLANPTNKLVKGYFQIDPAGKVQSPNDRAQGPQTSAQAVQAQEFLPNRVPEKQVKEVLEGAERNFADRIENARNRRQDERETKGRFPGVGGKNSAQWVARKGVDANIESLKKVSQIRDNKQDESEGAAKEREDELLEVVLSPLSLKRDAKTGGPVLWRYVDVPNEGKEYGGRRLLRYVQGLEIDMEHVYGTFLPSLVERYLDVPGGHAALIAEGEADPGGEAVFSSRLSELPSFRLVVSDQDAGWVDRRVSRLAFTLVAVAGGLLLVIAGGLFFTLRAVRAEVALADRKSDFVASVTHELRTPLTGIKMYADMLNEGWVKDEETKSEYVEFMASETDRLARLVNRVLDFARTDRGRREVAPIDLSGPIREVERDFGPIMASKGFALGVTAGAEADSWALADRDAVKQILLNLLENAVKYAADAEHRTILVRVDRERGTTALSVIDRGPGVPRSERERIFEDFYRPGEELTREAPGAGLGLALVRRLAESMGGRVELSETPGGGATFRVQLRAADPA